MIQDLRDCSFQHRRRPLPEKPGSRRLLSLWTDWTRPPV